LRHNEIHGTSLAETLPSEGGRGAQSPARKKQRPKSQSIRRKEAKDKIGRLVKTMEVTNRPGNRMTNTQAGSKSNNDLSFHPGHPACGMRAFKTRWGGRGKVDQGEKQSIQVNKQSLKPRQTICLCRGIKETFCWEEDKWLTRSESEKGEKKLGSARPAL